jgi:hypothetical protein
MGRVISGIRALGILLHLAWPWHAQQIHFGRAGGAPARIGG